MKKIISLALAASLTSVFCLQSSAWSKSSLLLQIPAILAKPQGGTTTVNDNVTVIDESGSAEIVGSNTSAAGDTELQLSGDLASSAQDGSVLYLLPGADDRFPFGIAGKVVSTTSNTDGTKTVVLGEATYADIVKEASFNLDNIVLDASNFVGVIAPAAVEAASPMPSALAKSVSDGSVYSFRDGAVVVRRAADRSGAMYSEAEGDIIDVSTVSLNMNIPLAKMGVDASRMSPIDSNTSLGFSINGSLNNIKITNEMDVQLLQGELKSLDLRLDGNLNFDVKFNGKGTIDYGYFSQAWNEVDSESLNLLGVKAKLSGLSSDDKHGKFPLVGLVWSVPCPNTCRYYLGKTQTPLRKAKALGVIVWVYLTLEGEYSIDGELHLARLNPARLSIGLSKTSGSDFQLTNSIDRISNSGRLIEAPSFNGTFNAQVKAGVTADVDFFASGVRIANAGIDMAARETMNLTGNISYGTDSLSSPWSWDGSGCRKGGIGAGAVFHAAAGFGIDIDTIWKDLSKEFFYEVQFPTDEEMDLPGWHGTWYTKLNEDLCIVKSKTGRIWMDRNLGASRAAISMDDEQAFGDLYQWGRLTDGHEKRTSSTTNTFSSTDVPGHGDFILSGLTCPPYTCNYSYNWRYPPNDNLWQGVNGINNPCPDGFRLPKKDEWEEEKSSWSTLDAAGAFASPLKLIGAGMRSDQSGSIPSSIGGAGDYWSSTTENGSAFSLILGYISYPNAPIVCSVRGRGYSVRCIRD